jgi:hypothetical protein
MIGTYKYKVAFDIPQDMYITNYTYSSTSKSWFSKSTTYVCVDSVNFMARGLTKSDIRILYQYATIMEEEFDKLQPSQI